jgi:hypothetical protein
MARALGLGLTLATLTACAPGRELRVELDLTGVPEATDLRAELRAVDCSGSLVPGTAQETQRGGGLAPWRVPTATA